MVFTYLVSTYPYSTRLMIVRRPIYKSDTIGTRVVFGPEKFVMPADKTNKRMKCVKEGKFT